jgi:hypothetical protein
MTGDAETYRRSIERSEEFWGGGRRSEAAPAFEALLPRVAALSVDHRNTLRMNRCRAQQKPDRR